ncbi:hypothetical protein N9R81_02570 [Flavobacteriales bacterium]|nr:hypothetical protein [Flavobacteriales bacterium]
MKGGSYQPEFFFLSLLKILVDATSIKFYCFIVEMKKSLLYIAVVLTIASSCRKDRGDSQTIEIPNFNYPETITFEDSLSAYNIYAGDPANLIPTSDFQLLELNSVLFTDYNYKQRLVKVPSGERITKLDDGSLDFPDGSILVKTFYYYDDENDTTRGKNIIESRLEIKESNTWNIASYRWNQTQTEAVLALNGGDLDINWINTSGNSMATTYHIPSQNECITCHQSNAIMSPIGPTLRNLNKTVQRGAITHNQLDYLEALGILSGSNASVEPSIPDYKNASLSLEERGRAYLDMNCAHCHNPSGWDKCAERDFDFRYETQFSQTGIAHDGKDRIKDALLSGEMPFIGTTVLDQEGLNVVLDYLNTL